MYSFFLFATFYALHSHQSLIGHADPYLLVMDVELASKQRFESFGNILERETSQF